MHNTSLSLNSLPGLLRSNRRFFAILGLVAIAFRVFFLLKFRLMTNDSFIYGDIAKNWLHNGIYGQTYASGPESGYIRLPCYPLFLVLVWLVAGLDHYTAVLIVQ